MNGRINSFDDRSNCVRREDLENKDLENELDAAVAAPAAAAVVAAVVVASPVLLALCAVNQRARRPPWRAPGASGAWRTAACRP